MQDPPGSGIFRCAPDGLDKEAIMKKCNNVEDGVKAKLDNSSNIR